MATNASAFVSVASQSTADVVHQVHGLATSFQSRISVAVLPQIGVAVTHALLDRIRQCSNAVRTYVDFHLVFPDAAVGSGGYDDFDGGDDVSYVDIVQRHQGMFDDVTCEAMLSRGLATKYKVTKNFENKVTKTVAFCCGYAERCCF